MIAVDNLPRASAGQPLLVARGFVVQSDEQERWDGSAVVAIGKTGLPGVSGAALLRLVAAPRIVTLS